MYVPALLGGREYPTYLTARLGQPKPSEYCLTRDGYKDYGKAHVDFGRTKLDYQLPYLNPTRGYLAELVLYNGEDLPITESFQFEGKVVGKITLKPGEIDTFRAAIPPEAYRSTRARLVVVCESGPFACLAGDANVYEVDDVVGSGNGGGALTSGIESGQFTGRVWPNPFHGSCRLSLGRIGDVPVSAAVYSAEGRMVRELTVPSGGQGDRVLTWDGNDANCRPVPAGIYYCRARSGASSSCLKLVKQ